MRGVFSAVLGLSIFFSSFGAAADPGKETLADVVTSYNAKRSAQAVENFYRLMGTSYDADYVKKVLSSKYRELPKAHLVDDGKIQFEHSAKIVLQIKNERFYLNDYPLEFKGRASLQSRVEYYRRVLNSQKSARHQESFSIFRLAYAEEGEALTDDIVTAIDRMRAEYSRSSIPFMTSTPPESFDAFQLLTANSDTSKVEIVCDDQPPKINPQYSAIETTESKPRPRHRVTLTDSQGSKKTVFVEAAAGNSYGGDGVKNRVWTIYKPDSDGYDAATGETFTYEEGQAKVPILKKETVTERQLAHALVKCCDAKISGSTNCFEKHREDFKKRMYQYHEKTVQSDRKSAVK